MVQRSDPLSCRCAWKSEYFLQWKMTFYCAKSNGQKRCLNQAVITFTNDNDVKVLVDQNSVKYSFFKNPSSYLKKGQQFVKSTSPGSTGMNHKKERKNKAITCSPRFSPSWRLTFVSVHNGGGVHTQHHWFLVPLHPLLHVHQCDQYHVTISQSQV